MQLEVLERCTLFVTSGAFVAFEHVLAFTADLVTGHKCSDDPGFRLRGFAYLGRSKSISVKAARDSVLLLRQRDVYYKLQVLSSWQEFDGFLCGLAGSMA